MITAEQSSLKHKLSQSKIKFKTHKKNLYSSANMTNSSCHYYDNDELISKEKLVQKNLNPMQHSQASFATSNQTTTLNVINAHNLVFETNNEEQMMVQRGGGIEEQHPCGKKADAIAVVPSLQVPVD